MPWTLPAFVIELTDGTHKSLGHVCLGEITKVVYDKRSVVLVLVGLGCAHHDGSNRIAETSGQLTTIDSLLVHLFQFASRKAEYANHRETSEQEFL